MTDETKRMVGFIEQVKQLLHEYETSPTFSMFDVMREMPGMCEGDVDLFLTACLRHRQHGCLVLAAVRYERTERMLSFKAFDLAQHSTALFWTDVIYYVYHSSRLRCLTRLMDEESLFQLVLDYASRSDISILRKVVRMVVIGSQLPQFKRLVYSDDKRVRQVVLERCFAEGKLACFVFISYHHRVFPAVSQGLTPDYDTILALACEAGLFMDSVPSTECNWGTPVFRTPFGMAVYCNQPDLVRFLYSLGTVSNHELFQLSRDLLLVERSEKDTARKGASSNPSAARLYPFTDDANAAREIRSFLLMKASQPRPLQSLCLQVVSRHVGWGHVRKANVEQLEIAAVLKDQLNFKHNRELLRFR